MENIMTASTPLLSLKGITKVFPGVRALENVQLDLWPGKVTALIGENGAGQVHAGQSHDRYLPA